MSPASAVFAHAGPLPLEELLPALTGAGAALLAARAWLTLHLRRHRGDSHEG
jgi:hypothetical protein